MISRFSTHHSTDVSAVPSQVLVADRGAQTFKGNGGGFSFNASSGSPGGGHAGPRIPFSGHMSWFTVEHLLQLALMVVVCAFLITIVLLYVNSILRFVLFNAVLCGDAHLASGLAKMARNGAALVASNATVGGLGTAGALHPRADDVALA
jgi:hypothetical protein